MNAGILLLHAKFYQKKLDIPTLYYALEMLKMLLIFDRFHEN